MAGRHIPKTESRAAVVTLIIGFVAASLSGVAVLLHAFQAVHLGFSVIVLAPATVVLILIIATRKQSFARAIFLQRLGAGLFAGLIGLIAYDAIRWVILITGFVPFNPFRAIEVFGLLILRTDIDSCLTKSVGWLFHIWNGLSFASMYTLALGRGRVWWAIIWSLLLEVAMLSTYPSMFRIMLDWPFLVVSLIGHLAYGLGLGLTARGAVKA
ncbi:MAG TPA: hypothetical protein VJ719_03660 [Chthoniobacterales bacterium]|nr:hypothetical protein [Chthoniobacterales bacterium]